MKPTLPSPTNSTKFLVRVSGESCWPYLIPGQTYQATRKEPTVGDFVLIRAPKTPNEYWVKQVKTKGEAGTLVVGSTVSWGSELAIPTKDVFAVVISQEKF